MAVSEAKKAYRQTPAEKEKRRLYAKEYRQRVEAKKRDAERAARRRAEPGGAELNRARVKANRTALGRNYLTELLADETGMPCRAIPEDLVALKRDQIGLRRLAIELQQAANQAKEEA